MKYVAAKRKQSCPCCQLLSNANVLNMCTCEFRVLTKMVHIFTRLGSFLVNPFLLLHRVCNVYHDVIGEPSTGFVLPLGALRG